MRVLGEQSEDHPNGDRDIVLVAFRGILEHKGFAHSRENQVTYRTITLTTHTASRKFLCGTERAWVGHLWWGQGLGRS